VAIPSRLGPLTGPEIEVIPARTTIVGVRYQSGTAQPLPTVLDDLVGQRLGLAELWRSPREAAGDKDVGLMGGGVVTSALAANLLDEVILHQVPVLLGAGHSFFQELPEHVHLRLLEAIPAPGVTHLHYEVVR
jgi:dihydrofolate reductase